MKIIAPALAQAHRPAPTPYQELIRLHSKARIIKPGKSSVVGHQPLTGMPIFSKPLSAFDVRERMAKQRY